MVVLDEIFCGGGIVTPARFSTLFRQHTILGNAPRRPEPKAEAADSRRSSVRSLHSNEFMQKTAASGVTRATMASDFSSERCIDARRYESFLDSQKYDFNDDDNNDEKTFNFYDVYRFGSRPIDRKKKYLGDSAVMEDHSWYKFPRFPVKRIMPQEIAQHDRPLTAESRYKPSELAKGVPKTDIDPETVRLQKLANEVQFSMLEKKSSEIPYYDPTAKYLDISYPGRSEERHVYDLKLNSKVYPDPIDAYIRFLQSKRGYNAKPREANFYKEMGLIRLGNAAAKDRSSSISKESQAEVMSNVEHEICASIDRISRLRRDLRLFSSDCTSKTSVSPSSLLHQLLDDQSKTALDLHEFTKLLRRLNIKAEPQQIDDAFRLADLDKDDLIDENDLVNLLSIYQQTPSESKYGYKHSSDYHVGQDFWEPFVHVLKCLLCLGENLRTIRLALTQVGIHPSDATLTYLKKKLGVYSQRHHVYADDIDFIASKLK